MRTRRATATDLAALIALYRELAPDAPPLDPDGTRTRLAQLDALPGSGVWLALDDGGRALATATVFVLPNLTMGGAPFALIENVVTTAQARRTGAGRAALDAAVDAAWAAGCYKAMLLSGGGPGAEAFYRATGFTSDKTGFQKRRVPPRAV